MKKLIKWAWRKWVDELYIPRGTRFVFHEGDADLHIVSSPHPYKWVNGYCETDGEYKRIKQETWQPIWRDFKNTKNSTGFNNK